MQRTLGILAVLTALATLVSAVFAGSSPEPGGGARKWIQWADSYDGALQQAADEDRVVFIAVNMDGERANDRMAEKVYRDKTILAVSERTINLVASSGTHSKSGKCPRFGCSSCATHRFVDVAVRENVLKGDASGAVIAPQHVFLGSDGSVLLSVPYEISVSELEWCFLEALDIHAGVEPKDRRHSGRRPRRLIVGDVVDLGGSAGPLTRQEALEIIEEHKKARGEREGMLRRRATADEPEAREYVLAMLRAGGGGGGRRGGGGRGNGDRTKKELLHWIGVASPMSYWEICAEFADSGSEVVKAEAIVALEQMAAEESLPMLMKALRRASTNAESQALLVRAVGATARDDKKARQAILRLTIDKKKPKVRANALIALGWLDSHEDIAQRLREAALPDVHGQKSKIIPSKVTENERLGAVVAMGLSRDVAWTDFLQSIIDAEGEDEKLKNAARASIAVIGGEELARLARFQKDAGSDKIERERLFGFRVERGGGN